MFAVDHLSNITAEMYWTNSLSYNQLVEEHGYNTFKNISLSMSRYATPTPPLSCMSARDSEAKPASHVTVTS